jgi:DNA (cytosine-5)-methyltransferase 1
VEREAAAASILVARMEDGWLHPAPIWSDLATFNAGAWRGAVDCVVSGDPCQPNSVAGRGLGADDERWLADRVVETFDRSGARRLFRENVPGNADGQLAYFVPALERLGCRVAVGLFSAKELGFAHGRERLFLMADRAGGGFGELRPEAWPGRLGHADGSVAGLGGHLDDAPHRSGRLHAGQRRSAEATADVGGSTKDWRTPQAGDASRGPKSQRGASSDYKDPAGRHSLVTEVAAWPTPMTRDHRSGHSQKSDAELWGKKGKPLERVATTHSSALAPATPVGPASSPERRTLNPLFVEWLMGWPIGWTDSAPVETESSRWWQDMRGLLSMLVSRPTQERLL